MPTDNKERRERRHAMGRDLYRLLMTAARLEYPRMTRFMRKRLCRVTVAETMAHYNPNADLAGLVLLASAKLAEKENHESDTARREA